MEYTVERWADERAASVVGDRRLVAHAIGRAPANLEIVVESSPGTAALNGEVGEIVVEVSGNGDTEWEVKYVDYPNVTFANIKKLCELQRGRFADEANGMLRLECESSVPIENYPRSIIRLNTKCFPERLCYC